MAALNFLKGLLDELSRLWGRLMARGLGLGLGLSRGSRFVPTEAPETVNPPVITGTLLDGETLTATTGTWTNAPTSYAYQWYDDDVAITGATSSTYVLTEDEIGGYITVGVVATNIIDASAEAVSDEVGPVTSADTTAPTLSAPVGTELSPTTATVGATTNEAGGAIWWVVTESSTAPSAVQIMAGQDNLGAAAAADDFITVGSTGAKTDTATGLDHSTAYYAHLVHIDASDNVSNIVSSAEFTTEVAPDVTAPTLTSPTDTVDGHDAMTGTVSTDEANGTLYWYISTSATPPSGTDLKAGTGAVVFGSQAVSATGAQNVSDNGLTPETAYYTYYLHRDAAGNDSSVSAADGFTTTAVPAIDDPVLADLSSGWTTGDNPPSWQSTYPDAEPFVSATGEGDEVRAVWRLDGGSWTTEDWEGLDDELITGTFAWPLLEAADLTAGGLFEVYEERIRDRGLSTESAVATSNTWDDELTPGGTPESASAFTNTAGTDKKSYLTVSGGDNLTIAGPGGGFNDAPCCARVDNARTGNRQLQFTVNSGYTSGDGARDWIGFDDGSTNLNSGFPVPGKTNSAGIALMIRSNGAFEIWNAGSKTQEEATGSAPDLPDGSIITATFDSSTGVVRFFKKVSGSTSQIGSNETISLGTWKAFWGCEGTRSVTALLASGQDRTPDGVPYDNI